MRIQNQQIGSHEKKNLESECNRHFCLNVMDPAYIDFEEAYIEFFISLRQIKEMIEKDAV
jgi:hypothetical protein